MEKTVLGYIENNDRYLMLYRNKKHDDMNEGKWLGVGGHIEENETPMDAIKREFFEETGLVISSFNLRGKLLFKNDDYEELIYLYTAFTDNCSIIENDEGTLHWINKSEILNLNIWEGDRCFLDLLINEHEYFELRLVYSNDKFIRSEQYDVSAIY